MRHSVASRFSGLPLLLVVIGCSSSDPPASTADGGRAGSGGSVSSGGAGASAGGKAGSGGSGLAAGAGSSTGGATAGGGAGGGTAGSASGSAGTLGGAGAATGGGGGASGGAGSGGIANGGAGAAGAGATGGNAGEAAGGMAGMAGAAAGAAGSGGPPACPAGALFCSGFEDAMLPAGATYLSSNDNNDFTKGTALDKAIFHAGAQSIEILKLSSYSQREVVVPAAQSFWFRAWFRTDVAVGGPMGNMHNLFFEAAYPGGDKGVEIVEEDCMLGMNIEDTRFGSNGTKNQPGCPTSGDMGTQLAANTWHCIEGHFDGAAGNVELFVGGTQVMALTGESGVKKSFDALRFGYRHYHERQRLVWYDDVATATARVGCQ